MCWRVTLTLRYSTACDVLRHIRKQKTDREQKHTSGHYVLMPREHKIAKELPKGVTPLHSKHKKTILLRTKSETGTDTRQHKASETSFGDLAEAGKVDQRLS